MEISLYGGTGFVGNIFYLRQTTLSDLECDKIHLIPRWSRRPVPNTDILYMISTTDNYNIFTDATLDVEVNLKVFTETLDSWRHNNPEGIFNFISSWFVYGDMRGSRAAEHSICKPKGFYSITKYCAEELLKSYATTFDLKYRILRLCNVAGNTDLKYSKKKNALQYLINEMKEHRDIELYNGGNFYRNYMEVRDVSDAIRLVMSDGELNSIYNIGSPTNYRFDKMIDYVKDTIGYKGTIHNIEPKDFHKKVQASSFEMNTQKLQNLGFVPKYDMESMLLGCIY